MCGPHCGIGIFAVADWWLAMTFEVEDERLAAAAPAKTTDNAKIRKASFIIGNLLAVLD
jgi:hypothetical protein